MALAAQSAAECDILREHPRLSFQLGPYSYVITREGSRIIYSASDGKQTVSKPVLWAFGRGEAGQTYVFQKDGSYYESKVSFFRDVQKLDVTLGHSSSVPKSLEAALGIRLSARAARLCIACHTTAAVSGGQLELSKMALGVTCEACHGPGAQHVAAMKAGRLLNVSIFNPGKQDAGDLNEFCGSCHRTWLAVRSMQILGVNNVRFQPYRLENSRCWDPTDARISCLACHNPHQSRQRDTAFYDSKCLSCHPTGKTPPTQQSPGAACPVGTHNCVMCHMPKYELPGGHFKFTDHQIRVVRLGESYPN